MAHKVISFYKYKKLTKLENLRELISEKCTKLNILGRILIGKEGINGAVYGSKENISNFKTFIKKLISQDLTFREQGYTGQTYHKLIVRIRPEIVHFGEKIDLRKKAKYISPEELEKLYSKKDDFIMIDARNDYEFKVGKFKNALTLPISTFRDFPKAVKKLNNLKNKKIITYCTGGIRCEKASAFLKQEGFKNVHQLHGGIINYLNKFPSSNFEGACFVFDDRLTSQTSKTISNCKICNKPSDIYINCHNLDCDKLTILCQSCQEKMNKTCSIICKKAKRQRKNDFNKAS